MATVPPPEAPRLTRHSIPTSAFSHQAGHARGDEQTLRVLRPLHRRGQVLGLIDEAITPSGSEVDIVLTSYGPLATHSVWHEHGLDSAEISELAAEARDRARMAGGLLAAVHMPLPVMPVVVVWGPDETAVPSGGRVRHDVMFLRGRELKAWLKGYLNRSDAFTADDASDLMVRLRAYRMVQR